AAVPLRSLSCVRAAPPARAATLGHGLEVLADVDALPVLRGLVALSVEDRGLRRQPLVGQAADELAVLEDERHLVRAHLEDGARALAAGVAAAGTGVEEGGG